MNHLGVFAKAWRPGYVKTRLAAQIGAVAAARLYAAMVHATLVRMEQVGDQRSLWFWPPENRDDFQPLATDQWKLREQPSGDLGARMACFFQSIPGARNVLIGSDSPNLPVEFLNGAFTTLADHDVVIGPSEDGGYYLIGMRCECDYLFREMPWSTPDVLVETRKRLVANRTPFAMLPPWRDIDRLDDVLWLRELLQAAEIPDAPGEALLAAVRTALDSHDP